MTQRVLVSVAAGAVLGAALVVLLGVTFGRNPFTGDWKTEVILSAIGPNGACELGKSTQVRVRKSKHLSWEIENYCTAGPQMVSIGNFRKQSEPVAAQDCSDPGTDYPFTDANLAARTSKLEAAKSEGDGSIDPTEGRIKLKAKDRQELGDTELTYYFDVCLEGRKVDPRLVIER